MKINRQFNRLVAAATATLSLVLISSPPTFAALAPNCVKINLNDVGYFDVLVVTNRCNTEQRVKVVLALGTDAACRSIPKNYSVRYTWGYPRRFDRLESC